MDDAAKDKEYELRLQDAEKRGLEKSMQKDIEQGFVQGRREAEQDVAASMLERGYDIETIGKPVWIRKRSTGSKKINNNAETAGHAGSFFISIPGIHSQHGSDAISRKIDETIPIYSSPYHKIF
ncbi:hypothetical protein [Salibacterium qingdaonense]|uniref:Uncharacterized protein n=1 Tax=Salibacterium qingdaonense TaxID=266892 RepID=A0A1I4NXV0_9BACI|nr:hypothetical protein [Salibacterium qingdaonense]SFM20140.1 hypothetical protein SAMN04488054_12127 [Salibacterium qingdaonense]